MSRRVIGVLLILALVALMPACQKLSNAPTTGVAKEVLRTPASIPPEWGRLVGVSSTALYPDLVQLWFQDDSLNVRMVVFSVQTGQLLNANLIPRG